MRSLFILPLNIRSSLAGIRCPLLLTNPATGLLTMATFLS